MKSTVEDKMILKEIELGKDGCLSKVEIGNHSFSNGDISVEFSQITMSRFEKCKVSFANCRISDVIFKECIFDNLSDVIFIGCSFDGCAIKCTNETNYNLEGENKFIYTLVSYDTTADSKHSEQDYPIQPRSGLLLRNGG